MAMTEERPEVLELESGETTPSTGAFARPTHASGWRAWFFTIDHKKIGIMYCAVAMFWFLCAGIEALLIRAQLFTPNGTVLSADQYNQLFTMHGTTMVFLVIMPLAAGFANYMVPLQIGARDVAFPRLNALGLWLFIFGGIFLNLSWFLGGGPDGGWFAYAPNTGVTYSPGSGMDFYALGLQIAGIASLIGSINLIVTILNFRAPGMAMLRMPVFTWMILVVQFLLLLSLPVITVALVLLSFDRTFDANFFNVAMGADPLLWQHLFWIFGHPEVYVLILPSFGIVSETLPVFSRKPLFGYSIVVLSGIAIGFMGWGVWAHHMFVSGLGPVGVAAFSATTMFIAVPTGVKILNWIATMWGGNIRFTIPMMFSISLVSMFTIGGLSGVMHAIAPADTQQTDTYFIVAHFHYVLFGGALMGLFAGMYYWWPKAFGYRLNEALGKWHFWLVLLGFNTAFGPMHILGLQGMARRHSRYGPEDGFDFWNAVSTIGAFVILIGMIIFAVNIIRTWLRYKAGTVPQEPADPWDGRTLEWAIPSPAPEHNFDYVPVVTDVDDFWHKKYQADETGKLRKVANGNDIAQKGDQHPHLPSPSYWPIVLAAGFPLIALGLIYNLWLSGIGLLLMLGAIFGWSLEPPTDPEAGHDAQGDDHHPDENDPNSDSAIVEEAPVG
ncbi:MAG: cytochrome c oxidase subunit I [Actinomycetota bacterium]|uniref:cytochrome-c oxidase n=1 Tax=marine metagenome TaxID=408172 RepID=A0A381R0W5_9ZZZZ|nr:cytochrome c oxidase subunit I [Acidimicrobiales bacterium]MEC8922141.1 cytochrome c oxidase subunit I [Actinomycetota bacterium]MEE3140056.1 cytochrome c oxidase subunit I [Actinomycetota bacterium]MEE3186565.1 cytochrome c oxidase subunit I [Actinomycetota bacterium]|tara:strand:- start:3786 stop:5786 length:2001 start_codon:yes stop_codon:yes gene_type:complete